MMTTIYLRGWSKWIKFCCFEFFFFCYLLNKCSQSNSSANKHHEIEVNTMMHTWSLDPTVSLVQIKSKNESYNSAMLYLSKEHQHSNYKRSLGKFRLLLCLGHVSLTLLVYLASMDASIPALILWFWPLRLQTYIHKLWLKYYA